MQQERVSVDRIEALVMEKVDMRAALRKL